MIYPPTLASTQPAFNSNTSVYRVYFTLQQVTSLSEIGHVQIRVVRQNNNKTMVNTSSYPDGVIYKDAKSIILKGSRYYVDIPRSDLGENWQAGSLYKIQVRFGSTDIYRSDSTPERWDEDNWGRYNFANWRQQQINNGTFSEWSTVMVIKAVNSPSISILNATYNSNSKFSTYDTYVELTTTPLFSGSCSFDVGNNEFEDKYRFRLFNSDGEEIESSGWLQHNGSTNSIDTHRFKTVLINQSEYTVTYEVMTNNNYVIVNSNGEESFLNVNYRFRVSRTNLAKPEDIKLTADFESNYAIKNGCIRLYLNSDLPYSGSFVISRTSEESNYQVYEELHYFNLSSEILSNYLAFTDFTIESGIKYIYAFQQENAEGVRTEMIYSTDIDKKIFYHVVNFQYSYLYRDGIQLRLQFNQKMSSFKHTTLRQKNDTLGSRYPFLVQNGDAYYAEFPITGLITYHSDEDDTFFKKTINGCYYKDELIIPVDKFSDKSRYGNRQNTGDDARIETLSDGAQAISGDGQRYLVFSEQESQDSDKPASIVVSTNDATSDPPLNMAITTDLTNDNIFVERKFREKVEEFLNDFDYKLYKSPTEGNIIVGLMNVSLTPVESLGRMVFEFSATAYEVLENTVENLDKSGIIDIGSFISLASGEIFQSFGQVGEFYHFWNYNNLSDVQPFSAYEDAKTSGIYISTDVENFSQGEEFGETSNIYAAIREQEEISLGGGYRYQLERVTYLWIENYPQIDLKQQQRELDADLATAKIEYGTNSPEAAEVQGRLNHITELQNILKGPSATYAIVNIDGNEILMTPGHTYAVEANISNGIDLVYASQPILVNYKCELTQIEDSNVGVVSGLRTSEVWGQLYGIFSTKKQVLQKYNYNYGESAGYRVPNDSADESDSKIIRDGQGNIIFDLTNFNVYKSLNLWEIIAEDARRQIENESNVKFKQTLDEDGKEQWTSGDIIFSFEGISEIEIEAAVGTKILISQNSNGSNPQTITMGYQEDGSKYPNSGSTNLSKRILSAKTPEYQIYNTVSEKWEIVNSANEQSSVLLPIRPDDDKVEIFDSKTLAPTTDERYINTTVDRVNRFRFNPSDNNIRYIALENSAFCIINYKCVTNQLQMKFQQQG